MSCPSAKKQIQDHMPLQKNKTHSYATKNNHKMSYIPHIIISIIAAILLIGQPIYETVHNCIEINKNYNAKEELKTIHAEKHRIRYNIIDIKETQYSYEFTVLDDDNVVNKLTSHVENTKIKLDESFTTPYVTYDIHTNALGNGNIDYNLSEITLHMATDKYLHLECDYD